jgi:hypothetical protein
MSAGAKPCDRCVDGYLEVETQTTAGPYHRLGTCTCRAGRIALARWRLGLERWRNEP